MLAHFGTLARHTALPRAGWVLFLAEHQTFGELQPDLGLEACAFSPLLSIRRFDGGPRHAELGGDSFEHLERIGEFLAPFGRGPCGARRAPPATSPGSAGKRSAWSSRHVLAWPTPPRGSPVCSRAKASRWCPFSTLFRGWVRTSAAGNRASTMVAGLVYSVAAVQSLDEVTPH